MENKIYNPDPLATWKEKTKDTYGLSYAQLISKEWFNGGMVTDDCQYGNRRDWIINKRLVARGEQDTKKYKEHLSRQEGDLSYLNLDWRIVNIPGKFCRIVSNGTDDDYYTLDIRATDRLTLQKRKDKMAEHRNNMRSLPMLKKVKEQLGLDLIPKGFIPEDEEELTIYSEIKDRPKIEIAEEITINYIKDVNNYDFIEKKKNKDLVEIGISGARVWTDNGNGVMGAYADPEYLVHSHVNKNDFSDATYFGLVDSITIDDIKIESESCGKPLTEKQLRQIAKTYGTQNKASLVYDTCDLRDLLSFKIDVLRFCFKTSKTTVYKAKKRHGRTVNAIKKDETYNAPERSDYGKISSTKGTWMEGTYVIGSDIVYNYKECEHIVRDELNKPISPFIVRATDIYKNKLHSFLDDIEPLSDQMQYIHLKIQHLLAELKPDLTIINEDALADLEGEGDKTKNVKMAINLLQVKGVIVEKTVDMGDMGISTKQAVRPSASQQGSALAALLNSWTHYYNLIRETTGINPARDGSLPHDALLGVNQMAQLASNTATQHIVTTATEFNKAFCEVVSSRVHNIFRSKNPASNKLKKIYERAVGVHNIEALEPMKDRHLHDFGFTVNMVPTQQELKNFQEDLGLFLQSNGSDVEVIAIKNEAQQVAKTNIKLATQYLFYMGRKLRKQRLEERAKETQMKSQGDIQSAQAAAQSQAQAYGFKKKADLQYEAQLAQVEVMKEQALQQLRAPEKEQEFKQEVFLAQIETAGSFKKMEYMEDRKDNRTKIQATQQARMIPERKSDNPKPIDFENEDIFGNIFGAN